MKERYLFAALSVAAAMFAPLPVMADGAVVHSFGSTAVLSHAGVMDVHEEIDYDPADSQSPLWRTIPLTYTDDQGRRFPVAFHLISAERNGSQLPIQPKVTQSSARLPLTADSTSPAKYELHFTLSPVVMSGVTKDVFKVTFTDLSFPVPVEQATLKFTTPGVTMGDPYCSTGSSGTTSGKCEIKQSGSALTVATDAALGPGEALSLMGTFPHDSFIKYLGPHAGILSWLGFAGIVAIPIGALVLVIALALRRARYT